MVYKVEFSIEAANYIKKMDNSTRTTLLKWINKNLINCEDPRIHGKSLTGNKKGIWRYRVGNYRVLCDIQDEILTILVLEVGHRNKIYK
ncbi:type II toxin-antitoxin system RelE/ParE family toxin [Fusobacterium perfoetens]|uniref:type II toxin-antitoxin system RelE family toxin n=1 Tax=Fusobacterium TaxID=848 RepID=UPI001476D58B|nr:type II toxin-antitoxin system RelE/ParE family toxin [Fusobacterium perfoetens]NME35775.1 type II toxin-antitoxin system RelE/ParE family toxin [Fusobacterium sp. FSA-380-WT-3A]